MATNIALRSVGRAAVVILIAAVLAACAQKQEQLNGQAVPGSAQDFVVNVGDRVYFAVDQTDLSSTAQATLDKQAQWLQRYAKYTITIEGHADERGTREYNLALGARRASSVRAFLASRGVAPNRMRTISYGKERPVAVCDNESCWSQNRRAVTVLDNAGS
ncbi:peptidoglycan-associated lipoprotein [Amorphus suaedae]